MSAGPSKLPELGKELGKTVKSFQTAAKVRGRGLTYICRTLASRATLLLLCRKSCPMRYSLPP